MHWEYIPGTGVYGLPYGCIVPKGSAYVWTVGRCFSATHDAHASCRSMAQTMSMGQAAGFAASLSLESDPPANKIDSTQLQERLIKPGAILEVPEDVGETGRDGRGSVFGYALGGRRGRR